MPFRYWSERYDAAMIPGTSRLLQFVDFLPVAESRLNAANRLHQLVQIVRLDRYALVGSRLASIQDKVLFEEPCADGDRRYAGSDVRGVIRMPDHDIEAPFDFSDDSEVHILMPGGIFRRAVHQVEPIIDRS